ncbi:hypothetical protein AB0D16_18595 [Streptomyces sp. NPDC048161]|uniref:hypothetical protein n=1 Tax=Streptomyces sp. NPDC048161 TaxID=3160985 RepID=UPI003408925F
MQQEAPRLWRAKDVATAFSHPSTGHVRQLLQSMARAGHFQEVRRKDRHLLFRIPTAPADTG